MAQPSDPMIALAYDCLQRELEALVAHRPAAGTAPTPQQVHKIRIATRRIRVALRLFRRMLPSAAKKLREDLGRFARALGEVRDLDVYGENFSSYAQAVPPQNAADLGAYELELRREAAEARNRLAAAFHGKRYSELLEDVAALVGRGAPTAAALRRWRSFTVADGADKYLKRSLKRVLELGRKTGAAASAEDFHRLRIRAKRLRYELEFFVPTYPALGKIAKAAKALQNRLGVHQDACTATERLRKHARGLRKRGGARAMPAALAALAAAQEQRAREVRERFEADWRKFERVAGRGKLTL